MNTTMLKPAIIAVSIITVLSSCSSSDEEVTINPRVSAWNAFTPVDGSAMPASTSSYIGSTTTPDPVEAPVFYTKEVEPTTHKASQPMMPGRGSALRSSY